MVLARAGASSLHISESLDLPLDTATSPLAILAIRGAGKTYAGSVLAEELLDAALQVVILDPTGAWWGLRLLANGKDSGYPVVIFGGEHADVPLDPGGGAAVADAIVDLGIAAILDLSSFSSMGEQRRFAAAFAERLYRAKAPEARRSPLMLIVDEADEFVPQRFTGDAAVMVGAFERLTKRGRIRAIGITLISQRAAAVNKDVLTQCGVLIALRTIGKRDRVALEEWTETHGNPDQRLAMMAQIAGLDNGVAWVFDPAHDIFQRIAIRRRRTYDSSATPEPGAIRQRVVLSEINLPKLSERLAASVEKAKEDDPRELRRQLAELKRQRAPLAVAPERVVERVEVPVLSEADRAAVAAITHRAIGIQEAAQRLAEEAENMRASTLNVLDAVAKAKPSPHLGADGFASAAIGRMARFVAPTLPPRRATPKDEDGATVSNPQQAILDALRRMEITGLSPAPWTNTAMLAHQSPKSSGFERNISVLRSGGLITGRRADGFTLTAQGRERVADHHAPATNEALWEEVRRLVSGPQWRILEVLLRTSDVPTDWDALAADSAQSPTSSGFEKNLSVLRSFGFIAGGRAIGFVATPALFIEEV